MRKALASALALLLACTGPGLGGHEALAGWKPAGNGPKTRMAPGRALLSLPLSWAASLSSVFGKAGGQGRLAFAGSAPVEPGAWIFPADGSQGADAIAGPLFPGPLRRYFARLAGRSSRERSGQEQTYWKAAAGEQAETAASRRTAGSAWRLLTGLRRQLEHGDPDNPGSVWSRLLSWSKVCSSEPALFAGNTQRAGWGASSSRLAQPDAIPGGGGSLGPPPPPKRVRPWTRFLEFIRGDPEIRPFLAGKYRKEKALLGLVIGGRILIGILIAWLEGKLAHNLDKSPELLVLLVPASYLVRMSLDAVNFFLYDRVLQRIMQGLILDVGVTLNKALRASGQKSIEDASELSATILYGAQLLHIKNITGRLDILNHGGTWGANMLVMFLTSPRLSLLMILLLPLLVIMARRYGYKRAAAEKGIAGAYAKLMQSSQASLTQEAPAEQTDAADAYLAAAGAYRDSILSNTRIVTTNNFSLRTVSQALPWGVLLVAGYYLRLPPDVTWAMRGYAQNWIDGLYSLIMTLVGTLGAEGGTERLLKFLRQSQDKTPASAAR